jgi:hypothetical protein
MVLAKLLILIGFVKETESGVLFRYGIDIRNKEVTLSPFFICDEISFNAIIDSERIESVKR